jgi:hypothetical protein
MLVMDIMDSNRQFSLSLSPIYEQELRYSCKKEEAYILHITYYILHNILNQKILSSMGVLESIEYILSPTTCTSS